nr:mechanosensitive ion channel domain-containing protein [Candidatus Hamiltonella defensa]
MCLNFKREELDVVNRIHNVRSLVIDNFNLLIEYAINIVAVVLIMITSSIAAQVVSKPLNNMMKNRSIDATVSDFLSTMVRYSILVFSIILVLERFRVQTSSVIALIGAAGFALQVFCLTLLQAYYWWFFPPFRAAILVDLGSVAGTVLHVQLFSTILCSPDVKIIVVPNGKIIVGNIINMTREPKRRTEKSSLVSLKMWI